MMQPKKIVLIPKLSNGNPTELKMVNNELFIIHH